MIILRGLSLLVLVTALIVPANQVKFLTKPQAQVIAVTFALGVLLLLDAYIGAALGLTLIILYYRVYESYFRSNDKPVDDHKSLRAAGPMVNLVSNFITEKHLLDAQNNIVDDVSKDVELKGIQGVYGEPVYGAQGLDKKMPGYEKAKMLTGDAVVETK